MAEFTEVMKQAARMCENSICVNCPLWCKKEEVCGFKLPFRPKAKEIETDVMQWAEENPEEPPKPVYPSWNEGWKQIYPNAKFTPCAAAFEIKCPGNCLRCGERPFPAKLAEKLGIKPIVKEGTV